VVAAVVLAAGASTRFGSAKQRILLEPVLERVRASSVDHLLVVLGAHDVETTAKTVRCPEWRRGPGASLRCGLDALPSAAEAAVVVLADGPDLAPAAVDRVVAAWRESGRQVVAATYGGRRGHPVLLDRRAWPGVPDEGARSLEALAVACDDLGEPGDVDLPSDLPGRLRARAAELGTTDDDRL
jgi:CTP:molybdopterin cytidylyltransferase MocA